MRFVVDENILAADSALGGLGDIVRLPGRAITASEVRDADALIVRSVTRVDAALLAGSRVQFVGSATIGVDHVDQAWLQEAGIGFAHAPGCNAVAVVDWVVAALAELAARGRHRFGSGTVGVVGAGNVGSRVASRLAALGYTVRIADPPRAQAEGRHDFVPLAGLQDCDVTTLHVPLTSTGVHATVGMINQEWLARLPAHGVLLNAARGGVVDETALQRRLEEGPPLTVALDCWVSEPDIDWKLLAAVDLGTPHIAGYSVEGKLRGTAQVAQAAAAHFGRDPGWDWRSELPPGAAPVAAPDVDSILRAYPIQRDDAALREVLRQPLDTRAARFDQLRRDYPIRREIVWD